MHSMRASGRLRSFHNRPIWIRRLLVIEGRLTMSARDWAGHLPAIPAYPGLRACEQEQEYCQIMPVLPETAGITGDITVHLARRL